MKENVYLWYEHYDQAKYNKCTIPDTLLYNGTNEIHFLSFIFDNNLYMFQTGKLFIIMR
jgi:hypothetical protein